ncbi:MAG: carboxypeptidase-like regulatory domain-containing protein [Cyclobacteriaceae bacterium]
MKKILVTLSFAILAHSSLSQQISIDSQILDQDGNAVPFAAIGIVNENFGAITFEDGSFSLDVEEKYMSDSLVISAIGYERTKVAYSEFVRKAPSTIQVKQSIRELDEVLITPEGLDYQLFGEKKKRSNGSLGFYDPQKGATLAVLLNEERQFLHIKEIRVSVGRQNLKDFQLRTMIFSMGADSLPGEQLLKENLILESKIKKGVVTFELTKDFWTDEPVFVGFEWIVSRKQFETIEMAKEAFPLEFIDEIDKAHPDLKFSINDSKVVNLRNDAGDIVKSIELTEEQQEQVKERRKLKPRLYFQTHTNESGLKAVTGSHITSKWRRLPYFPLVSIWAGTDPK